MQPPIIGFNKKKSTILPAKYRAFLVENTGIEPTLGTGKIDLKAEVGAGDIGKMKR